MLAIFETILPVFLLVVLGALLKRWRQIDRDMWNRLQGFDPRFFMYGEDTDLCLRAMRLGARPMITPDATIIHYGAGSSANRAAKLVRLLSAEMALIGMPSGSSAKHPASRIPSTHQPAMNVARS